MSTTEVTRPLRGYNRRRKLLLVDLNVPPGETLEETTPQPTQTVPQGRGGGSGSGGSGSQTNSQTPQGRGGSNTGGSGSQIPATIDVEAIDDEVIISSPTQFAEARKKSRRSHNVALGRNQVSRSHPGNSEEDITRLSLNSYNMRRRVPPNQTVIDCEQYIDLESNNNAKKETVAKSQEAVIKPPKEPTFSCPVCMGPLVEEASTKCGHIFCKECIKAVITAQSKCPTCRRKLTMKDIIRVYLPATS
ncbi:RING/U-box superfamily protein [Thalictrum thalictroides]|uniref:RING/U-box superfamily protein n=1 Tax=Thalictrum thalictroides TaxID=46969 RepID=A0A7J6UV85_THATH|nr:RING/U-box superfamily protein [Thalictrum thalictroides]